MTTYNKKEKIDLQDIKSRIAISEFASRELGCKVTKNKTMCCHLHHEKSPSLHFNDEKNFYYCYGCHKAGDIFALTQEIRNFSFLEAVKFVASTVGIKIEDDYNLLRNSDQSKEKKEILYDILEDVCIFFESKLKFSNKVTDYLKDRSLSFETIKKFRLGFSPEDSNNELIDKLRRKYSNNINLLLDSGLFKKGFGRQEQNFFNILHGRVIFPIFDKFGRVIAFGGRILPENESQNNSQDRKVPKYINCGDSLIFKKNENLYGENFARQYMKETDSVIIVEGYLDVLSMYNANIKNVIAPLGTAVSEFQLQYLWGITDNIKCCFDGDLAGEKASFMTLERGLPIIKAGKFLFFSYLPEGSDPDQMIRENKTEELKYNLENSTALAENLFQSIHKKYKKRMDPDSIAGMKKTLISYLKTIKDSIVKEEYARFFKGKFENEMSFAITKSNILNEPLIFQNNKTKKPIEQYININRENKNNKKNLKNEINRYDEIFCYIIVLIFNFPNELQKFIKNDIINLIYSKTRSRHELEDMLQFAKIHCFNKNLDDVKRKFSRFSNGISNAQQEIDRYKDQSNSDDLFLKYTIYNFKILDLKERKKNLQGEENFLNLMKIDLEEKRVKKLLDEIILNEKENK